MSRWFVAVALFAGVALAGMPVPAHAADEKTLGCVADHLDAPALALIETYFEKMILSPEGKSLPDPGDAQVDALAVASDRCAKLHGWSDTAMSMAVAYTVATVGRAGAERALTGLGVNPAPIAKFYYGLPLTTRQTAIPNPPWPATIQAFAEEVQTRELFDPAKGRQVGRYLGCLNVADSSRVEFLRA